MAKQGHYIPDPILTLANLDFPQPHDYEVADICFAKTIMKDVHELQKLSQLQEKYTRLYIKKKELLNKENIAGKLKKIEKQEQVLN